MESYVVRKTKLGSFWATVGFCLSIWIIASVMKLILSGDCCGWSDSSKVDDFDVSAQVVLASLLVVVQDLLQQGGTCFSADVLVLVEKRKQRFLDVEGLALLLGFGPFRFYFLRHSMQFADISVPVVQPPLPSFGLVLLLLVVVDVVVDRHVAD